MKKNPILAVVVIFVAFQLSAQNFRIQAPPGYNYIYPENNIIKGVEGSPYMADWEYADILFTSGGEIKGLLVRYNVYTNQLLYQENNQTYQMGAPDSISEMTIANKEYIYREYLPGKKTFFEVEVKGKVSLLTKYEVEVTPANYNEALMSGNKNDVLNIKKKLYLQQGANFIPISKKDQLLQLLSDKKTEVANLMAKEKLSYKKKQDVMEIVSFYNQL
jgi:hypothetical protein